MLLTIRQSGPDGLALPYLLHSEPDSLEEIELPSGKAKVFFPEHSAEMAEAALLLEADPQHRSDPNLPFFSRELPISQYVNGQYYRSSALMSVALEKAFPEALAGECKLSPDAVDRERDLEINLAAVLGAQEPERMKEILALTGYAVELEFIPLVEGETDAGARGWGNAPACHVKLKGKSSLVSVLRRIYLVLALLEEEKEFWIGPEAANEIWRNAEAWLPDLDLKSLQPVFFNQRSQKYNFALKRLAENEDPTKALEVAEKVEAGLEETIGLEKMRREALHEALKRTGARTVVDLNCGNGKLVEALLRDPQFSKVSALDITFNNLLRTADYLNGIGLSPEETQKLALFPSSPLLRDERTTQHDAVILADWIEHLPQNRLSSLEMSIFRYMKPKSVLITTPNAEYNPLFSQLPIGQKRHPFHKFEWTRAEFKTWADKVAEQYQYKVEIRPIGPADPQLGAPTLLAVFTKTDS